MNLFLLSNCLLLFYFACLTSALILLHWSVVCLHVPWYWQNFFPVCPWSKSLSSESLKVTPFLFLDPFLLFLLFLEGILGGMIVFTNLLGWVLVFLEICSSIFTIFDVLLNLAICRGVMLLCPMLKIGRCKTLFF